MFIRMLRKSFSRNIKTKLLAVVTIIFGATLASAVLNVSLDIGDKVNKELKNYGANLLVQPKMDTLPIQIPGMQVDPLLDQRYIPENKLPQLKMIFWRHNIVGFAPLLTAEGKLSGKNIAVTGTWFNKKMVIPTGETFYTGVKSVKPWWQIEGNWPNDTAVGEALITKNMAKKLGIEPGDQIDLNLNSGDINKKASLTISGIVSTGSGQEKLIVPLDWLQLQLAQENKVAKIEVSALTTPENALARKYQRDPQSLSSEEFETWYCTAYVDSIAYQIEEAIPGVEAKQIRQVAQSEGKILSKIQLLMALLTIIALLSSTLGISNLMTASVLERSKEIGLYKALGATNFHVVAIFMAEAGLVGLLGGVLGYGTGFGFAQLIGKTVFTSAIGFNTLVIPLVIGLSLLVAILGTISAMGTMIKLHPAEVLHGR